MDAAQPTSTPGTPPAVLTMEAFFTRERANEGIEFPLDLPDGTPTAHRIRIRGVDSDAFKAAKAESARRLAELLTSKEKATLDNVDHEAERLRLLASLVVSWTFPQPITLEGVCELFRQAPQIADQIDKISGRRALFFRSALTSSTTSPRPNSS